MSERKFYKTLVEVEILSEDNPVGNDLTLGDIQYEITQGHCSGVIRTKEETEVPAQDMVKLLQAQGSDPEFFQLDVAGNNID